MSRSIFYESLVKEVSRIDQAATAKRNERVIEGFTQEDSPKALIGGERFLIFNSNDYLGLRHNPALKEAEHLASSKFGTGPGAVRFISGTLLVNKQLEQALAEFHEREEAMVFSSAFATNLAVLFSLIKGQSKDSLMNNSVMVVSDELNHRSIIDGIRIANLDDEQKAVFKHMDVADLRRVLQTGLGRFDRSIVVTDGVFSMLGEVQRLKEVRQVVDEFDTQYPQGVLLIVDDAHGIGALGTKGRGVEEATKTKADVLIGTLGKALGADGGYVVGDKSVINYLRESAATYIYSNSVAPGTAAAALRSIRLIDESDGVKLLNNLRNNIGLFKTRMDEIGFEFASDSDHPIQPILIGDPEKTAKLVEYLFEEHILATKINYPVVPKGRDEIRIQLSAVHTKEDIDYLVEKLIKGYEKLM